MTFELTANLCCYVGVCSALVFQTVVIKLCGLVITCCTFTVAPNLQAQESRGFYLGLKDRITRNYLDYNKSRILWSHDNYEKVGCLTVMTVKVRLEHFCMKE